MAPIISKLKYVCAPKWGGGYNCQLGQPVFGRSYLASAVRAQQLKRNAHSNANWRLRISATRSTKRGQRSGSGVYIHTLYPLVGAPFAVARASTLATESPSPSPCHNYIAPANITSLFHSISVREFWLINYTVKIVVAKPAFIGASDWVQLLKKLATGWFNLWVVSICIQIQRKEVIQYIIKYFT